MRQFKATALAILTSLFLFSCNNTQKAVEYNDQIIGFQTPIIQKMLDLSNSIEAGDSMGMYDKLQALNNQIDLSIAGMQKMEKFDDKTQLKEKMMKAFEFYKGIAMNEYKTIIDIVAKPDEMVTDEDRAVLNKIAEEISAKETAIDNEVAKAQADFAKANHMELTDNKLQKEIDKN